MTLPPGLDRIFAYLIALEAERARRESSLLQASEMIPPPIAPPVEAASQLELSIVLPVWSPQPAQFRRCLSSLAAARLESISHEILVSDNASPDDTVRRLVEEAGLPNIRYVRQERNLGGFGNFNWCLENARGAWVHLISHDDWIDPEFYLELLRGPAQSSGAPMRFCRTKLFFEDAGVTRLMFDEAPQAGILADFLRRQVACQRVQIVGAIVNRQELSRIGGYDPRLGAGGDWEFWVRWAAQHPVFYSPRTLATYTLHSGSWSTRDTSEDKRAESLARHRDLLLRILRHIPDDLQQHAATGFYRTMLERFLNYTIENNRAGRPAANTGLIAALMPGIVANGLGTDLERLMVGIR